jgi:excisionase family DNA binding protein
MRRADTGHVPMHSTRWITINAAAEYLGVSVRTVRRPISSGELPAYRIGGGRGRLLRINVADIEALLVPVPTVRRV